MKVSSIKIAFIGDELVGKTAIINRFVGNSVQGGYESKKFAFLPFFKTLDISEKRDETSMINITLHDSIGFNSRKLETPLLRKMASQLIDNDFEESEGNDTSQNSLIKGYVFVFSLIDPESAKNLQSYIEHVVERERSNKKVRGFASKKLIVAHKSDLIDDSSYLSEFAQSFTKYNIKYVETSIFEVDHLRSVLDEFVREVIWEFEENNFENNNKKTFSRAKSELKEKGFAMKLLEDVGCIVRERTKTKKAATMDLEEFSDLPVVDSPFTGTENLSKCIII